MGFLANRIVGNIKEVMKDKNIKHNVFYSDTGIHIGRILATKNISLNTLEKISQYLDTSIENLIK